MIWCIWGCALQNVWHTFCFICFGKSPVCIAKTWEYWCEGAFQHSFQWHTVFFILCMEEKLQCNISVLSVLYLLFLPCRFYLLNLETEAIDLSLFLLIGLKKNRLHLKVSHWQMSLWLQPQKVRHSWSHFYFTRNWSSRWNTIQYFISFCKRIHEAIYGICCLWNLILWFFFIREGLRSLCWAACSIVSMSAMLRVLETNFDLSEAVLTHLW